MYIVKPWKTNTAAKYVAINKYVVRLYFALYNWTNVLQQAYTLFTIDARTVDGVLTLRKRTPGNSSSVSA